MSTGSRISSSGVVCGRVETTVGVIIVLFLFLEGASSDNMGNKEFRWVLYHLNKEQV